jgi:hypothetical protein
MSLKGLTGLHVNSIYTADTDATATHCVAVRDRGGCSADCGPARGFSGLMWLEYQLRRGVPYQMPVLGQLHFGRFWFLRAADQHARR